MTDIWRLFKLVTAALISAFLGLHVVIQLLVYAIAFDIATGVVAGWVEERVSSEISRKGMARKLMILLGVAAAEVAGRHAHLEIAVPWGGTWGLGAAIAAYYCIHEAISICENLARAGVPLPEFVMKRLQELQRLEGK
ncbi:MAG: hypothetical protein KatS3mg004_1862 [Bryobacteraceae bacterium]|nr:MAG: hypothetical protein KatS3mg004_1862 [Bryobacteraceae bacterium]